jgi:hypothetical protein
MRKMIGTFKEALHEDLQYSPLPARAVAEELGISYSMLMNSCNPDLPEFHLRAGQLSHFCRLTHGRRALDWLEASVCRVAIELPDAPPSMDGLQTELFRAVKEFGEMTSEAGKALQDGRISRCEAKRIERAGQDLIRQVQVFLQSVATKIEHWS